MNRIRLTVLLSSVAVGAASTLVSPVTASAETSYPLTEVRAHATSSNCWSIVNGGVYNLTAFIGRHEGGPAPIKAMCGLDGTVSYTKQHPARSGENEPASALAHYRIGVLDPASVPAASTSIYTLATIGKHDTATDCWSAVNGKVYNLTAWVGNHPGGAAVITGMCGLDGTGSYAGKHKGSATADAYLGQFVIGNLDPTVAAAATSTFTLAQVAAHGRAADCWSAVSGGVYDLTKWIGKHPGGQAVIKMMCGVDGTAMYEGQHKGSASAGAALAQFKVGTIGTTGTTQSTTQTTTKTYTMKQVRKHNTRTNCWSVVNRKVYNLTKWIPKHPGGKGTIIGMCGKKASKAFTAQHGGSASAKAALNRYKIGRLA
jgi:cytochrome b involved in lipid metabolism